MQRNNNSGFTLIEVLVVLGIFTLAIGLSFTVLSSSRLSVNVSETQIQAQERARKAMHQITTELHLASPGRTQLFDDLTTQTDPRLGNVIFFQIPLQNPDRTLNLEPTGDLRWGSRDPQGVYVQNQWISYSAEPEHPANLNSVWRLVRRTHPTAGGVELSSQIVCDHLGSLEFSRRTATDPVITVQVQSVIPSNVQPLRQILRSRILLRNR